jgi:hypothetical protein
MIICFLSELRKRKGIVDNVEYDKNTIREMRNYLSNPSPPVLKTCNSKFKDLYALSIFEKNTNPVHAICEAAKNSYNKKRKTKFDKWIITLTKNKKDELIMALEHDIPLLQTYIKKVGSQGDFQKYKLLKNLIDHRQYLNNIVKD